MMTTEGDARPFARTDITVQVIGDEVMLYDSTAEKIHVLNHSAYTVWKLCNGINSIDDICAAAAVQYPDAGAQLAVDVHSIIVDFKQKGLLSQLN